MKRLLALAALGLALTGCGRPDGPVTSEIDKWPKNDYTETLPKPAHGSPSEMILDEDMGYCSIIYEDVTSEECEEYVEALKEAGFTELEGVNDVAALGVPLEKDGVYVNVAASDDTLGISVSKDED